MPFALKERLIVSLLVMVSILLSLSYLIANIADPTEKSLNLDKFNQIERYFLVDKSKRLSVEDIISTQMTSQTSIAIPWSFESQAYWLKIGIKSKALLDQSLVMHFDNPMLDQLDLYQYENNTLINSKILGWQENNKSILNKAILHYQFDIKPHSENSFFVRIESSGISKTPINIYHQKDFVELVRSSHLIWGAFIGILCMMALYNLVLFYGLKERIYLIYIGYLTSILTLISIVQGFGHYLFPHFIYEFLRINVISLNFLSLAFALLFAMFFLNYHKTKEKIYQYGLYYFYALLTLTAISIFIPENTSAPIFFVFMAITYLLCFTLFYKRYNTQHFTSTLYIVSWVPLLIGAAIQPLELTDVIPYSFFVRNIFTICILFEITLMAMALAERIRHQKELTIHNATHDLDTNLPNFHALETSLQYRLENQNSFTICLIKISGLDKLSPYLNEDQTLSILNTFLDDTDQYFTRHDDFLSLKKSNNHQTKKLARVNEEVFACLLRESKDSDRVKNQLQHLLEIITKSFNQNLMSINFKVNVSFYMVNDINYSASDILKKSFQALKVGTRENLPINNYENHKHYSLTLADELKAAIFNNELMLYHQPQIEIKTNRVHGSEALLRWDHPQHGFIPADNLIALAEDTGLINQITLWVIRQACLDIKNLILKGYTAHTVSVNISGSDIASTGFLENLKVILTDNPIPPRRLILELTESVMIDDYEYLQHIMQGLDELGISVSIDDYGTGYSSLSHILQLPFNELKIDRIFIQNIKNNERNLHIVGTTINMAKILNLTVVAEGIETHEDAATLYDLECDLAQGYYYSMPLFFDSYIEWIKNYDTH